MKKIIVKVMALMLTVGVLGAAPIQAEEHMSKPEFKEVKLTDQQLAELETLYEDLINQRKGILNKYEEFGVLSKEDVTKMKEHLDMFSEKMKKDGFIPKWDKHHKEHKKD